MYKRNYDIPLLFTLMTALGRKARKGSEKVPHSTGEETKGRHRGFPNVLNLVSGRTKSQASQRPLLGEEGAEGLWERSSG